MWTVVALFGGVAASRSLLDQMVQRHGVFAPKVGIASFEGVRGLCATQDIVEGEKILSIPLECVWCS